MPHDASPPRPDRTVIRPRPGARGAMAGADPFAATTVDVFADVFSGASARAGTSRSDPYHGGDPELPLAWAAGENPLINAAHPLLTLVNQMRGTAHHPDPAGLRDELARAVTAFEQAAAAADVPRETIVGARYLLCTFIDETAAGTPWGGQGAWASDTLLTRFFNETWGGEKSFVLLSRLSEAPDKNRHLLELFHLCLSLGFEGRYRVLPNGRGQVEQLRERLFQLLRQGRPEAEPALSGAWGPATVARRRWYSAAPFWAYCVLVGAAAIGSYLLYSSNLATRSDDAFAAIAGLQLGAPVRPAAAVRPAIPAAVAPAVRPRLAALLASEANQGLLTVSDTATRSIVILKGDLSFDPGSAQVSARMRPVLDKVGKALATVPGSVLISGHTDSIPIRTARFPSNWHLSRERATAVMSYLSRAVPPSRMQAEGRADTEALASNETPDGRAANRRVEINLFVTQ